MNLADALAAYCAEGCPAIGAPHPDEPESALWRCVTGAWAGDLARRASREQAWPDLLPPRKPHGLAGRKRGKAREVTA
jgi:hypothetical protein